MNTIIEKIRAEVERRMRICERVRGEGGENQDYYHGKAVSYNETLTFLSDLEKEEKHVPADLEEAAKKYAHCPFTDDDGNFHEDAFDVNVYHDFIAGAKWQKEQMMIRWTGNNLKDLIEFTGKSPRFNEWFKSWDDYEDYVRQHGNIFKMFNDDGSHLEVPVGAWIVKTPDKRCVASKFTLKQPESEKIAAAYQLGLANKEKQLMKDAVEWLKDNVKNYIVDIGVGYGEHGRNVELIVGGKCLDDFKKAMKED